MLQMACKVEGSSSQMLQNSMGNRHDQEPPKNQQLNNSPSLIIRNSYHHRHRRRHRRQHPPLCTPPAPHPHPHSLQHWMRLHHTVFPSQWLLIQKHLGIPQNQEKSNCFWFFFGLIYVVVQLSLVSCSQAEIWESWKLGVKIAPDIKRFMWKLFGLFRFIFGFMFSFSWFALWATCAAQYTKQTSTPSTPVL